MITVGVKDFPEGKKFPIINMQPRTYEKKLSGYLVARQRHSKALRQKALDKQCARQWFITS